MTTYQTADADAGAGSARAVPGGGGPVRVAYADPPYLGCASYYDHPESAVYDTLDGHRDLIARLVADFPNGWAMNLHTPGLRHILPLCPEDCRVGAWVKPWASFKPGVNPGYAWEPVVWRGGRRRSRRERTVRDWCSVNATMGRRFCGAKPDGFSFWVFDLLGLRPGDEFVDLFPGSGAVGRAWRRWCRMHDGLYAAAADGPTDPRP